MKKILEILGSGGGDTAEMRRLGQQLIHQADRQDAERTQVRDTLAAASNNLESAAKLLKELMK